MRLSIGGIFGTTFRIFLQNWVWITLEYAGAVIVATSAFTVFFPDLALRMLCGEEIDDTLFLFVNPHSLIASPVYTFVTVSVLLRLWPRVGGTPPPVLSATSWVAIIVLSLLVDHLLNLSLFFMIIPLFIVSALTTLLMPLLVIEQRGWQSLSLSLRETMPHLLPLSGIWAAVLIPWLMLIFTTGPQRNPDSGATLVDLWAREIAHDLVSAPVNAFCICLIVAVYLALRLPPQKPDDLEKIFR
ncbi:hypothetical protein [Algicella marina]|uniref:Uncharacterized protein n=1 Tax=Algicella marina TaxID=2683284 RepID=A0A6P1SX23_9RHOB|nr:hypothetical protein [Algicella marina]QHQ33883.1 hypothetical protein GO499_01140 [Algicella marina]